MHLRQTRPVALVLILCSVVAPISAAVDMQTGQEPKPGQRVPFGGKLPSLVALNVRDARLESVLREISEPWAFEFIAKDEIILTQIRGRLSRFNLSTGVLTPVTGLPEIATDKEHAGLLDVEIHPDFRRNHRIYLSYAVSDQEVGRFLSTAVATAILDGNRLRELREIVRVEPMGWSPSNFGGALEFDDRGFLFVATGDRSDLYFAQDGRRLEGKVLRLRDDGSSPPDNPFVNDPQVDDRIYALGVRNPQGLHFDVPSQKLFEAEHGPMGGDEVNVIRAGANYGWPTITYGENYTAATLGLGGEHKEGEEPPLWYRLASDTHQQGLEQPLWYYLPSEAVSPVTVYRGAMFPEWDGHLLVGALKGKHVSKVALDGDLVRSEHGMLREIDDRVRDIKVADDGSIFVLTQNKGLFRLYRQPGAKAASPFFDPAMGYDLVCAGCHDTGAAGAPLLSKPEQWAERLSHPPEVSYRMTLDGYGAMPERGLCHLCSDEQIRQLVDYVLDQVRRAAEDAGTR